MLQKKSEAGLLLRLATYPIRSMQFRATHITLPSSKYIAARGNKPIIHIELNRWPLSILSVSYHGRWVSPAPF
jgi:hypothetical protein